MYTFSIRYEYEQENIHKHWIKLILREVQILTNGVWIFRAIINVIRLQNQTLLAELPQIKQNKKIVENRPIVCEIECFSTYSRFAERSGAFTPKRATTHCACARPGSAYAAGGHCGRGIYLPRSLTIIHEQQYLLLS